MGKERNKKDKTLLGKLFSFHILHSTRYHPKQKETVGEEEALIPDPIPIPQQSQFDQLEPELVIWIALEIGSFSPTRLYHATRIATQRSIPAVLTRHPTPER
ncbi:hypothetical protein M5K25_006767 [Dendrobium thyrsiflorum]|uniref:Uncharacterized protein n=1 Tax=Dendrobium thyrsiflorum TaxID=117978 RepID=A0ABD0VJB1_DENTH